MAVFESGWKPNMSEEEGKKLVRDAIAAGIFNDLGSGSNVDLCVIRNTGPAQYLRTYEEANVKVTSCRNWQFIFAKYIKLLVEFLNNNAIIIFSGQKARVLQISPGHYSCAEAACHSPGGNICQYQQPPANGS